MLFIRSTYRHTHTTATAVCATENPSASQQQTHTREQCHASTHHRHRHHTRAHIDHRITYQPTTAAHFSTHTSCGAVHLQPKHASSALALLHGTNKPTEKNIVLWRAPASRQCPYIFVGCIRRALVSSGSRARARQRTPKTDWNIWFLATHAHSYTHMYRNTHFTCRTVAHSSSIECGMCECVCVQ